MVGAEFPELILPNFFLKKCINSVRNTRNAMKKSSQKTRTTPKTRSQTPPQTPPQTPDANIPSPAFSPLVRRARNIVEETPMRPKRAVAPSNLRDSNLRDKMRR